MHSTIKYFRAFLFKGIKASPTVNVLSYTRKLFIVHQDSTFLNEEYALFSLRVSGFNIFNCLSTLVTDSTDFTFLAIVIESITTELNGHIPVSVVCAD